VSETAGGIKRVVIVGGGLAGMSAAEALARTHGQRWEILLLESRRSLGGRAGSFVDPVSGETVDYCQHVAMGCCTNLIGLLERCGLSAAMRRYSELQFLHPGYPPSRFAASRWLPPPLHLLGGLCSLRFLDRSQQRQILAALVQLLRSPPAELRDKIALEWLANRGQSPATIRDFWSVFVVSALGEHLDAVAMGAVGKLFVDGFAAARGASDLLVPRLPLAELFGRRLGDAIAQLGVEVRTGTAVRRIEAGGRGAVIQTKANQRWPADHVIVAVPWHELPDLVSPVLLPGVERYSGFPASPISGLHLWWDRPITDRPHAVLTGTTAQWLFRQPWDEAGQPWDEAGDAQHYYQVVISGSQRGGSISRPALLERVLAELRQVFPAARDARLLRSRIVTDPHAVFSARPEVESLRPASPTPLPWLHLAGDWTATGWPATMEGAVISGRRAASSVAEREGLTPPALDPGLPRGWLAAQLLNRY
jgi:squalene-associated FAD-dependent desaturase